MNLGKRLIKTPKLYFHDTGLLCYLLGIRTVEQLEVHPLRGSIFECWVASEIMKHGFNRGLAPQMFFFRDRSGNEVDLILERATEILAVEVKAGRTASADYFAGIEFLRQLVTRGRGTRERSYRTTVIYGGTEEQRREHAHLRSWSAMDLQSWLGA